MLLSSTVAGSSCTAEVAGIAIYEVANENSGIARKFLRGGGANPQGLPLPFPPFSFLPVPPSLNSSSLPLHPSPPFPYKYDP